MKQKIFTLFFALAASVGTLFAESGTCGKNVTWSLENGVLTISGTGAMTDYSSYTSVPWYSQRSSINLVIVSNDVTSIGNNAFSGCSNLASVTIPNSVINIGYKAFDHCISLPSLTIPNSVTSIGYNAFYECRSLTSVTIPNSVTSIATDAFGYCSQLASVHITDITAWCNIAFSNNYANPLYYAHNLYMNDNLITDLLIPNNVTKIKNYAFEGCTCLISVTIPNSIISIGSFAFNGCSSLTSVTLPNSVTSIGESAFSGCTGLTSVAIPNSVTSIGESAFSGCTGLTSVAIPNSVISIGDFAFSGCSNLPVVDNLRYADTYLTEAVDKTLSSYSIKEGTKWIGTMAFEGCTCLTSLTIPNSIINIGHRAFDGCSDLTSVTIGDCVTYIGGYAFSDCRSLTSVIIPNSVTSIGRDAFGGCSNLTSVIVHSQTPPTIDRYGTPFPTGATIYVPNEYVETYKSASNWESVNIKPFLGTKLSVSSTSTSMEMYYVIWDIKGDYVASVGVTEGATFDGNTLEYIGLEPNSTYNDIPVVLTSNIGETETVNVSFTTSALELTTQPSKPVSSTTAILLANTNMADAEVSCGFEWKRNDAPADMAGTKVYCPVANGTMAGRLKNLKDDVYYKYRAFYESAAGNMYYGEWQYIFTGDNAVEFDPILYTYGATVVQENEATISGYALAGSEDFTEQGFEYWAESRVNEQNNAPQRMAASIGEHKYAQASGIKMSVTLTDLDEGTVYKYRAYGKTGNQFFYGSEQTFTTQGEWHEEQGIEDVLSDNVPCTKILHDGQIYIMYKGTMYNVQGQKVK